MTTPSIADRLSNKDLETVRAAIEEILTTEPRTKAADVFIKLSEKIQLPQTTFCQALSANIASGRLSGYYSVRGPYGGIFKGEAKDKPIKAVVERKVIPVVEKVIPKQTAQPILEIKNVELPKPKLEKKIEEPKPYLSHVEKKSSVKPESLKNILHNQGESFFLFINEEKFRVPCHFLYIKTLVETVFAGKEDLNGNVKLQDKIYLVEDTKKLEGILYWFLNASIIRHSGKSTKEPVLNIVDDKPIEISQRLLDGTG